MSAQMSPLGGTAHATAKRQMTIWCVIYDGLCQESWPSQNCNVLLPPQNIIIHKCLVYTILVTQVQFKPFKSLDKQRQNISGLVMLLPSTASVYTSTSHSSGTLFLEAHQNTTHFQTHLIQPISPLEETPKLCSNLLPVPSFTLEGVNENENSDTECAGMAAAFA